MAKIPRISDYMTETPVTIELEASLSKAVTAMQQHRIRHLPVTRDGEVVGIVSDRDIKLILGMKKHNLEKEGLRWVYSPVPYEVSPQTSLAKVVATMKEKKYGSALIVKNNKLLGIFTVVDALEALSDLLSQQKI